MRSARFSLTILAFAAFTAPLQANAAKNNGDIDNRPPAPIYEVDQGTRPGYILTPGYWRWDGKHHVWMPSRWIAAREGYIWTPDQWEQRGEKWHFAPGHWEMDEAYEEVEEPTPEQALAATPATIPEGKKKPVKKQARRINYHDTRKWPRVIHH